MSTPLLLPFDITEIMLDTSSKASRWNVAAAEHLPVQKKQFGGGGRGGGSVVPGAAACEKGFVTQQQPQDTVAVVDKRSSGVCSVDALMARRLRNLCALSAGVSFVLFCFGAGTPPSGPDNNSDGGVNHRASTSARYQITSSFLSSVASTSLVTSVSTVADVLLFYMFVICTLYSTCRVLLRI